MPKFPGWHLLAALLTYSLIAMSGVRAHPQAASPAAPPGAGSGSDVRVVGGGVKADRVVVITLRGRIDRIATVSVERRIAEAAALASSQSVALVFEIDTDSVDLGTGQELAGAVVKSGLTNTAVWINTRCTGGAVLLALSCRSILIPPGAVGGGSGTVEFGDAFRKPSGQSLGRRGLAKPETYAAMREGVLVEAVESARRMGRDEFLAQALVVPAGRLFVVEELSTGERVVINQGELDAYFSGAGGALSVTPPLPPSDPTAFWPAGATVANVLTAAVSGNFRSETPTKRVNFAAMPAGKGGVSSGYRLVGSMTDGTAPLVMGADEFAKTRLHSGQAGSLAEVQGHFGASSVVVLDANWSERLASFVGLPIVTGILIAVFLICMFLEMTHPGVVLPGLIALVCLIALTAPGFVAGIASWWALAAIIAGIVLLLAEVFIIPGFGVAGVVGMLSIFCGLVFSIAGNAASVSTVQGQEALLRAVVTVLLSVITAFFGITVLLRRLGTLPILNRYVLRNLDPGEADEQIFGVMPSTELPVRVGDVGRATGPLRPSGKAEFGDQVIDVVADFGIIEDGHRVRVVSADQFKIVVSRVPGENA